MAYSSQQRTISLARMLKARMCGPLTLPNRPLKAICGVLTLRCNQVNAVSANERQAKKGNIPDHFPELEIKDTTESNTSASYLDLLLSIGRDGQLRTSLYDKRDDFNFHIANFPFLSSNIPSSPAYGVFISQLIRYARACSSYECFILRAMRISNKLLGQGYVKERLNSKEVLWSVRGSHQTI